MHDDSIEGIENRRNDIGPDIRGKASAKRQDGVHLPPANQSSGDTLPKPAPAGPEWQCITTARGKDLGHVDRRDTFFPSEVVSIHGDARPVLRVRIGSGAASFEVLLNRVVHQECKAVGIALVDPEIH